jgi:hypothetical protein
MQQQKDFFTRVVLRHSKEENKRRSRTIAHGIHQLFQLLVATMGNYNDGENNNGLVQTYNLRREAIERKYEIYKEQEGAEQTYKAPNISGAQGNGAILTSTLRVLKTFLDELNPLLKESSKQHMLHTHNRMLIDLFGHFNLPSTETKKHFYQTNKTTKLDTYTADTQQNIREAAQLEDYVRAREELSRSDRDQNPHHKYTLFGRYDCLQKTRAANVFKDYISRTRNDLKGLMDLKDHIGALKDGELSYIAANIVRKRLGHNAKYKCRGSNRQAINEWLKLQEKSPQAADTQARI